LAFCRRCLSSIPYSRFTEVEKGTYKIKVMIEKILLSEFFWKGSLIERLFGV
jgi:hypothetical protein